MSDDARRQRLRLMQMQARLRLQHQQRQAPDDMEARLRAAVAGGEAGISPERRAAVDAADAQAMQGMEAAGRQALVERHPVGSRAAVALQGMPFVGEYLDEATGAIFGPDARDRVRAAQRGIDERSPVQALALRMGGGVVGSAPLAMAAVPGILGGATSAVGGALRGAAVGAAAGGIEGAVSGFGAGEGDQRLRSAVERGALGAAMGGAVGAAVPAAASGIRRLLERSRANDVQTIARQFGISDDAARVVRESLRAEDYDAAMAAIQRAGGRAMLADAGTATQTLLDASMTGSTGAARVGRDAVEARAQAGGREFVDVLDRFFGRPQGVQTTQAGIRASTAGGRAAAYDAAYATPIDYAARAGQRLEALWERVPAAVRQRAVRLMQLQGEQSRQVMARIADDGTVTFSRPADVRQWDYITRALNDLAESGEARGAMGGMTAESRALTGLAREIRDVLRGSVPAYNDALRAGADAIGRTRAVDVGASLLLPSTTREQAREAIRGMTSAERTAARQGLRSYIDDLMARTSQILTDPTQDAREAIAAWRALSSRRAQDNIAALMGEGRARGFAAEVERIATDFQLRAAVAQNSRTAVRQSVQGTATEIASETGLLGRIMADPLASPRTIMQALTGTEPGAVAARRAGLYEEIAAALTRIRGAREAQALMGEALRSVEAEPMARARAERIARLLTGAAAGSAYQAGQQSLAPR